MLLVILLVTLTVGGYFGVRMLDTAFARSGGVAEREAESILAQSKAALLAWSIATDDNDESATVTGTLGHRSFRPGNLPYPDLVDINTLARPSDGIRDHGCALRTWTGTQALVAVERSMSAANKTRVRCFGRLPVRTLGMDRLALDAADDTGRWPWYAVSANLVNINHDCPRRLDPAILDIGTVSTCSAAGDADTTVKLAFPWITVLDPAGAVVSTRAAAVILLPGPATTRQPGNVRQARSTTALPTAFLDTVDSPACGGLPAGRCDNGRFNQTPALVFVQCVSPSTTTGDTRFNANYACNDRLAFITIDELMGYAAKRMEREFVACLREFSRLDPSGNYPWPSAAATLTAGVPNQFTPGMFPSDDESLNPLCPSVMNPNVHHYGNYWGGWQRDALYTVAADRKSAILSFKSLPRRNAVKVP